MPSDTYTFPCPACGTQLSVPTALAGVRGPCPQCRQDITAPPPPATASPAPAPQPSVPEPPPATVTPPPVLPPVIEASPSIPALPTADPPPVTPPVISAPPAVAPLDSPPEKAPTSPAIPPFDQPPEEVAPPSAALPPLIAEQVPEEEAVPLSRPVEQTPESLSAKRLDPAPISKREARRPRRSTGCFSYLAALVFLLIVAAAIVWLALTRLPGRTMREWEARAAEIVNPLTRKFGFEPFERSAAPAETHTPQGMPSPEPAPNIAPSVRPALDPVPPENAQPEAAPSPTPQEPEMEAEAPEVPAAAAAPEAAPSREAVAAETSTPPSLLPEMGSRAAAETMASDAESEAATAEREAALVEPLKTLNNFLQARNWTERLRYCLDADRIRADLKSYYRGPRDIAEKYTSTLFYGSSPLPDSPYSVNVFHVTFTDLPEGFPVSIVQTAEGWKVDWEAFVEFRDSRLKKFLSQYQDAPATFRVRLERTHYFDSGIPDIDDKYCFRISAPIDGHEGYAFIDKNDSIAGPKLAPFLAWETIHHVIVKLKWVKGLKNHSYVELRDLVSPSWRLPKTETAR